MAGDFTGASADGSQGGYAQDGSVDLKGNPVLRSKRGGWTACSFVVAFEAFERMAYYGISSNLMIYLTKKLHQGTVTAANNVTNWVGTGFFLPLFGAYVADAHLGRYRTFVVFSVVYVLGMLLLTVSVSVPSLAPPPCDSAGVTKCEPAAASQVGLFFGALYMLAVGTGGTKPNISTIGADQFDDFDPKEKAYKISFFNWWMFSIYTGTLFANLVLVYLQDNVSWSLGYGIPAAGLFISMLIFLAGTPLYRHKLPQGSPITRMARVLVAAIRKRRVPLPNDAMELHELDVEDYARKRKSRILSTNSLRFLSKAAVRVGQSTPWMLCTVTEVEETKRMLQMVPIFVAMFIPSAVDAQVNTLFIKQGTTLDRRMGPHFQIPPGTLVSFVTISMLVSLVVYDRFFVKKMRIWTKNPRGITLLQRTGTGLVVHVVTMLLASLTERIRLSVARDHGVTQSGGEVPLTIFVLLPQFVLMGLAECFVVVGKTEFFYNQAPESMKSLGTSLALITYGFGNLLSSFLLSTVSNITKRNNGHGGWILDNLNVSHLDYYYMFLAVLSFLNFLFFLFVSRLYVYKAGEASEATELSVCQGTSCSVC